ncbi:MAG: nuclear transport factor 2 family protein [Deltaproteobacteria bacterium]|nr:nuclear transport factor 2 family protein [Deltaproteobacteria bacterium]
MTDPTRDDFANLRRRVERIEAIEACRGRFNAYLHYLDAGHLEDLLGLFADDARLELRNFPPGTGGNLLYTGPNEIRDLYAAFVGEGARHHSANVSVVPSEALDQVEVTAYFLTTIEYTLTGGIYELQLQPRGATWQVSRMRISSTWGWAVPHSDPPFLKEPFSAGTLRDGRPPSSDRIDWE